MAPRQQSKRSKGVNIMTALIEDLQGHQSIKTRLEKLAAQDILPQNLLFLGPSGVGKAKMALALAQIIACETSSSSACGHCGPCLRTAKKQSESLCYIQPEKNIIKVEQARIIINFLHLQALGKAKIVIIQDAQHLNHQASNALLKTLEEPPPSSRSKTYFIFTANNRGGILPTLSSRFQHIIFSTLSQEDLQKIWPENDMPEWMFKSCQGRSDLLKQLLDNAPLRKEAIEIFENLFQPKVSSAFLKIQQQKQLDRIESFWITTYLSQFLRDVLLLKLGSEDLIHRDLKPSFIKFLNVSKQDLFDLFAFVTQMSHHIEGYVDRALLFEQLVLKTSHIK